MQTVDVMKKKKKEKQNKQVKAKKKNRKEKEKNTFTTTREGQRKKKHKKNTRKKQPLQTHTHVLHDRLGVVLRLCHNHEAIVHRERRHGEGGGQEQCLPTETGPCDGGPIPGAWGCERCGEGGERGGE